MMRWAWRAVLAAMIVLGAYALWWEPSSLRAVEHDIVPGRGGIAPLRIAVIADLHAGSPYIDEAKVRRVVALADGAKPDLILLAGDYVAGARFGSDMPIEKTAGLLKGLHAPLGVYAVLGNHDHWHAPGRIAAALKRAGITVLENDHVAIARATGTLYLAGIGDDYTGNARPAMALRGVPGTQAALCFTHSPDIFPGLPPACALTVAGHTHGGQVWLPVLGRVIVPSKYGQRYASGLIRDGAKTLFVSTGIGTSILPVRLGVAPEVSILNLRP